MSGKKIHIDPTETSPEIDIDIEHGVVEFIGRSLPNNSDQFYQRVYHWIDEYLRTPKATTTVNIKLDYLDTSSSKHFYNIFERLNAVTEQGQTVDVRWHFEHGDEDMEETGKDYENLFNMNFQFIEQEELF